MEHTDNFADNWRIQGEGPKPLELSSIDQFIDTYGREQAIGYIRAIRDMVNEIEYAAYDTRPNVGLGSRPLTRMKNNLKKLLLHKENFLLVAEDKLKIRTSPNPG
ncbi:hypothetical protein [Mucilaginibacter phyllosphaerae]|uniref:Uncharacterized protein n=1 Tax=Mucilaginibacter phyllosphaerae TaxID=1812349 RepID=A0A4Y8AD34_9SPHI|nr:hypothetical protein [Mucilaginibacter phyllosphaerae]MBB3969291.1 hypothetical protein [Mucilaginibacter phyllosphaerae]TEW65912.1 hypothetical protein E2R65_12320 [Mucilaginibacter phyllosphaerae]GGH07463.1 hypothetical protein GCM10007352_12260 [Mucilaginibacter phyllosphaerae]